MRYFVPSTTIKMEIVLSNVGKRFNREWIFRHVEYLFVSGKKYAVTGANGSGKSTLLQVIAGSLTFNEGHISFSNNGQPVLSDQFYQSVAIAAPYLELIEEMTALEMLEFHNQFKSLVLNADEILRIVGLEKAVHKQIRYFSSGMKQRLKMAQAFFSDTPVLFLDEPTSNLDEEGIALYQLLISDHTNNRLVIVSSNDKQEYDFCDEVIAIGKYK